MLHESYAARKIVKRGGYSYIIEYNEQVRKFNRERELIDKGIAEVQNELKQLEQEKDDIQKGQKKNELNRRIADLLERRSRTVNQSGERVTNGERTVQADKQQTGTTDTDTLIRQTKAVNDSARAELANTRLDSEQSKSERTNIADKSGKQTSEEKRRRNRR